MNEDILECKIHYNWFGAIADHCLDGVTKLHDKTLNPAQVKGGDVVFVKTDFIYEGYFQAEILPEITQPFTLAASL